VTAIPAALDLTLPGIESNLALDEALLIAADEHGAGPALRFWEPGSLAVVLGATGRLFEDVDVAACRADGVAIARRSSGGGTVVVGPGTLNVAVVLAADAAPGLGAVDRAQHFVLERIAGAVRTLGPRVEVLGLGDLTVGGRKCAGSAQRRLRHYFLVHATLLYDFPLPLITRYTALPKRQPAYRAGRSHADFLTNLGVARDELKAAIRSAWGVTADGAAPAVAERLINELVATKFGTKEWVERL
jgi:lipoate-protein ligase A